MPKRRQAYAVFLRGINVGGKNRVPMAGLRTFLEAVGFSNVSTYIASGNVILESELRPDEIRARIEKGLPGSFKLDSELIRVLVMTPDQLRSVVDDRPKGFGEKPGTYHSDAIFLLGIDSSHAMAVFNPREGVDKVWPGEGVVYSQRLSAQRTKSRLNRIMGTPAYKSMTIRNWATTTSILERLEELAARNGPKAKRQS